MSKYAVLENGKPAILRRDGWNNNIFISYKEAFAYAKNWLGDYGIGLDIPKNVAVDYNGYGDTIEIREVKQ